MPGLPNAEESDFVKLRLTNWWFVGVLEKNGNFWKVCAELPKGRQFLNTFIFLWDVKLGNCGKYSKRETFRRNNTELVIIQINLIF